MSHKDVLVYAKISKIFHWIIAVIVLLLLSLSFFLDDLSATQKPLGYMIHKSLGLTVLFLMIFRLIAIHYYGRPLLPVTVSQWERVFSRLVQFGFYIFLFLMPLSGWILSTAADKIPQFFGLFPLPFPGILPSKALASFMDDAHKTIAWILIVLAFFHITGALKHHFFDKDNVLKRIWF